MSEPGVPPAEERVLVLAPTAKDAGLCRRILAEAGLACAACADLAEVCRELAAGAGTALLAEEALSDGGAGQLAAALAAQPPWSDFPVLVLTRGGIDAPAAAPALDAIGNVTLLERPLRVAALVSAVRAALRARRRQYQIRAYLEERERAAETLRRSEERFRLLVEGVQDYAIIQLDPHGTVAGWNGGAERILGYRADEILGEPSARFFTPEDVRAGRPEHELREATATGSSQDENWLMRKDGSRFYASGVTAALRDGKLHGFVKILRDLTERKRLEEALQLRADELAEAGRRKDEFLAMLAHELRNPLASLRNALHVLHLRGTGEPAVAAAREMMERQVRHLARMVDDLLDVSRITRGKVELRKEWVDLGAVLRRTVEANRPFIEARRHELAASLPPRPVWLEADPTRLEQVFANLLLNAAKYTDPGGRIELSATVEGSAATVRVRDNGSGITPELLPRVFDLFTQGERGLDRSQGGLGVGLTLVRSLVEMHGGGVQAYSAGPSRGSEFVVHLPVPAGIAPEPPAVAATTGTAPQRLRVLVVEDNLDTAQSLATLLALWGHEVRTAHNGPDGLRAAQAERPDVVLLDIGLPGIDGFQVARRLRDLPALARVRLVALSGYGREEDRRRSQEAGFDLHLTKPVDPVALEELLAGLPQPAA